MTLKSGLGNIRPWCVSQTLFQRAVRFLRFALLCDFLCQIVKTGGLSTPQKRQSNEEASVVVLISVGTLTDVPVYFRFLHNGKVAKPTNHPCRSRRYTAFAGITPLLRRVPPKEINDDMRSCKCVCVWVCVCVKASVCKSVCV